MVFYDTRTVPGRDQMLKTVIAASMMLGSVSLASAMPVASVSTGISLPVVKTATVVVKKVVRRPPPRRVFVRKTVIRR